MSGESMKRISILLCVLALSMQASFSLSKKDKQDLEALFQEPIEQINKTIGQLNAYASQMQVVGDLTVQADVHELKKTLEKILSALNELDGKVDQVFQQLAILRILVGNPDDPSVDPSQFTTVQAIDDANLPLYQWIKTTIRAIVEGSIVS